VSVMRTVLSKHNRAIVLSEGSRGLVVKSYLDANNWGIIAKDADSIIRDNSISGKGHGGLLLGGGRALIEGNTIRRLGNGIHLNDTDATMRKNTVTQNGNGILVIGGKDRIYNNAIFYNRADGVSVRASESESTPLKGDVEIVGNTVSNNGVAGLRAAQGTSVAVKSNVIEANWVGTWVDGAQLHFSSNTVVYHSWTGIRIGAGSQVELDHNIVAYNPEGIFIDVTARAELAYNDVYGNLATSAFPLIDANYVRQDRLPTATGERIRIKVFPAYDLKGPSDVSVDPEFVDAPKDYRPAAGSALAKLASKGDVIGALAPAASRPTANH
jgi:parallel beta-helix repeat protein